MAGESSCRGKASEGLRVEVEEAMIEGIDMVIVGEAMTEGASLPLPPPSHC